MELTASDIADSIFRRLTPGQPFQITLGMENFYAVRDRLCEKLTVQGMDWLTCHTSTLRNQLDRDQRRTFAEELFNNQRIIIITYISSTNAMGVLSIFNDMARNLNGIVVHMHLKMK